MLLPIPKAAGPGAQGQLVGDTAQSTNYFDDSGSMLFKNTGQVILKLSKIRQFLSMESKKSGLNIAEKMRRKI